MSQRVIAVALVGALVGACAGEGAGGGLLVPMASSSTSSASGSSSSGGESELEPSAAEKAFVEEVYPTIATACVSCHGTGAVGPQFLGPDAASAYATIRKFPSIVTSPEQSRLLTKGKHSGPALTAAQAAASTNWLELELLEHPELVSEVPTELSPQQELEAFGKCISKVDWEATKVYLLAKQTAKSQNNLVPCSSCHGGGANGTFIDDDPTKMLEATRKIPHIFKFASATLDEEGTFADIAFANRWAEKGAEGCPPVGNCHPEYILDGALVAAINELYALTYDRWKKDACPADPEGP